jgi:hypothetical protein
MTKPKNYQYWRWRLCRHCHTAHRFPAKLGRKGLDRGPVRCRWCLGGWKRTEDDVEDDVAAGVGHWLPCIDDLLLELVEEAVILLRLLLILGHVLPVLIFVLHLNEVIIGDGWMMK